MKRALFLGCLFVILAVFLVFLTRPTEDVQALPEYSAQTGEPCATCHVSPSGGGPRTPRGQAWIADEKPGTVPNLLSALELLGVNLDFDPTDFTRLRDDFPPAQPLPIQPGQAEMLRQHLRQHLADYPGN